MSAITTYLFPGGCYVKVARLEEKWGREGVEVSLWEFCGEEDFQAVVQRP